MMLYRLLRSASCLLAATPLLAQPAAPTPASSRWHLDGSTNRCVLTRQLQGPAGPATFILRTIPGSDRYEVILAGAGLDERIPGGTSAQLSFVDGGTTFQSEAARVDLPGSIGRGVVLGGLPRQLLAEFGRGSALRLGDGSGREVGRWTLPIAARAAEVVADCEVAKLVEWGADPTAFEAGATPARPSADPRTWITVRDFGLFRSQQPTTITVVFRLVLNEAGQPTACTLLEFASNMDIESDVCRVMMRAARYEPARNAQGLAVRTVAVQVLTFRTSIEFQG